MDGPTGTCDPRTALKVTSVSGLEAADLHGVGCGGKLWVLLKLLQA